MNEYLPTLFVLLWAGVIGGFGYAMLPLLKRSLREEEEQFYREIYGPGGKPKKEPAEQSSPEGTRA
jgi:hypothetical protein